jgi:hypothetical protein
VVLPHAHCAGRNSWTLVGAKSTYGQPLMLMALASFVEGTLPKNKREFA